MATHAPRPLRLTTLVDQQLWYIGHDIRHADGNALARFGFERRRGASGGTSCYRLPSVDPSRQLLCWGFGIYVGAIADPSPSGHALATGCTPAHIAHGVFLSRHAITPRLVPQPLALPLHQPSELPPLRSPVTPHDWQVVQFALQHVANEFGRYEQWARDTLGAAHRTHVLARVPRHKRRRFAAATHLADSWQLHTGVSSGTADAAAPSATFTADAAAPGAPVTGLR